MGSFFGSVHLRTDDRAGVRRVVEDLAKKQRARFLIGPRLRGWIGIYPEHHGQDERVAQAIARKFPGEVLYVMVHDDDLFAYAFYRGGRLVDQYRSCTDYDDEDEGPGEPGGRPELLRDLLPNDGALAQLLELFAEGQPLFASETLQRFAAILGLANTCTSYEYLQNGERDDVEGWDDFVHIPDQSAENARQRSAEADLASLKERLRADGLLLVERSGPAPAVPPGYCPDREGSGFLISWPDAPARGPRPVEQLAPPWDTPRQVEGILAEAQTQVLELSPAGRYLAMGDATGKTRVWDLDRREQVLETTQRGHLVALRFSPDEKHLIALSYEEGVIAALDNGRRVAAFAAPGFKLAAVHPSGTLVVADEAGKLTLLDLPSGQPQKTLLAGGGTKLGFGLQRPPGELGLRKVDPAEMEARIQEALQRQLAQAEAMQAKVREAYRKAGLPEPADLKERMQKELQKITEMARPFVAQALKAQRPDGLVSLAALQPAFEQAAERVTALGVSTDGRWLFYTCENGVRVLAWDDVLAATGATPRPRFAAEAEPVSLDPWSAGGTQRHTYALAHDAAANRLLFAGLEGTVRSLDLADGTTGVVLNPPGRPPILSLRLSRDGSALCCVCMPDLFGGAKRKPPVLQVWNYARLGGTEADRPTIRLFPG